MISGKLDTYSMSGTRLTVGATLVILIMTLMVGCGSGSGGSTAVSATGTDPQSTGNLGSSNPVGGTSQGTVTSTSGNTSNGDSSVSGGASTGGVNITPAVVGTASTGSSSGSSGVSGGSSPETPVKNVLAITVNGSLCSSNSYPNKPCVSVTVCTPGTTNCQAVTDILLDTGSYGLRIFKQALKVPLVQSSAGTGQLTECIHFGDGSAEWGPVQTASVVLGNEPAVQMPIQVIDASFSTPPSACRDADESPSEAGYNGLLGVGLFAQDCGAKCTTSAYNGMYYTCSGTSCSGTMVALSGQVQNPVVLLPEDNNGVIVQLPSVPSGGAPALNGYLVLGIGTQSNNVPTAAAMYSANQYGEFSTRLNGVSYSSFIDSGSNGLFFTSPSASLLPRCSTPNSAWFCPSSLTTLTATNIGVSGSASGTVSFQISNFNSLIGSTNQVFAEMGGTMSGSFDWGLPFYFGRYVYMGMEGKGSSLGSGPCWAY